MLEECAHGSNSDSRHLTPARAQRSRRAGNLRNSRRFRAAVLQGHRGKRDPPALHAEPRARRRLRRGCRGALSHGARRRCRHLRRRSVQSGQPDRGCVRRAITRGRDRRCAGRARARQRFHAASSGAIPRHPIGGLPRDHLRPGGAQRRGNRAGPDRTRAAQRARTLAAGLHRASPRHDRGARRRRPGPAGAAGRSGGARRVRRRDHREARAGERASDPGRRGGSPLRARSTTCSTGTAPCR